MVGAGGRGGARETRNYVMGNIAHTRRHYISPEELAEAGLLAKYYHDHQVRLLCQFGICGSGMFGRAFSSWVCFANDNVRLTCSVCLAGHPAVARGTGAHVTAVKIIGAKASVEARVRLAQVCERRKYVRDSGPRERRDAG